MFVKKPVSRSASIARRSHTKREAQSDRTHLHGTSVRKIATLRYRILAKKYKHLNNFVKPVCLHTFFQPDQLRIVRK